VTEKQQNWLASERLWLAALLKGDPARRTGSDPRAGEIAKVRRRIFIMELMASDDDA
jgi:hypothetical protein